MNYPQYDAQYYHQAPQAQQVAIDQMWDQYYNGYRCSEMIPDNRFYEQDSIQNK